MLGALEGDHDGDESSVFLDESAVRADASRSVPTWILVGDFFENPYFLPGKQYIYGLHLLTKRRDTELFEAFRARLREWKFEDWPEQGTIKDQLSSWNIEASGRNDRDDLWWGGLELMALRALAWDPGMDLGIFKKADEVCGREVLVCGAAKKELYPNLDSSDVQSVLIDAVLTGKSLELLSPSQGSGAAATLVDPIHTIMVAAQLQKPRFGGEIRHLIFKARKVNSRMIRAAQALTRRMTQAVLSVKSAGNQIPHFSQYKQELRSEWIKEREPQPATTTEPPNRVRRRAPTHQSPELSKLFAEARAKGVVAEIKMAFASDDSPRTEVEKSAAAQGDANEYTHNETLPWQQWFFAPHKLLSLLHPKGLPNDSREIQFAEINVPLDDLRVRPWIRVVTGAESVGSERPPQNPTVDG